MYSYEQMGYEDYKEMMNNSKPLSQTGDFIKTYIKAIIDIQKDEDVREEMLKQIVDVVQEFDAIWKDAKVQKKRAELAEMHVNYFLETEKE